MERQLRNNLKEKLKTNRGKSLPKKKKGGRAEIIREIPDEEDNISEGHVQESDYYTNREKDELDYEIEDWKLEVKPIEKKERPQLDIIDMQMEQQIKN